MSATPTTAKLLAQLERGNQLDAFEAAKLLSHRNGAKLIANPSFAQKQRKPPF